MVKENAVCDVGNKFLFQQPEAVCPWVDRRKKDVHSPAFPAQPELQVCLGGSWVAGLQGKQMPCISTAKHRKAQGTEVSLLWTRGDKPKMFTAWLPGRDGVCMTEAVLQPAQERKE